MLKYVLLGALSYQPMTGYQLKQFLDRSTRHFWYAQTSQIYRTLDALEKEGLLASAIEEREDRPDSRLYRLTPAGQADLMGWLEQPMTEIGQTKDALLVRLFFAAKLDKETLLTQLRLQRALHQRQASLYKNEIDALIKESVECNRDLAAAARDALLWDITRRCGELSEEAYLRWLDETIQRIEDKF